MLFHRPSILSQCGKQLYNVFPTFGIFFSAAGLTCISPSVINRRRHRRGEVAQQIKSACLN